MQTLARRILNNPMLNALCVPEEIKEVKAVLVGNGPVKLKRTFNMQFNGTVIKYWRVVGPIGHKNYHSDLSLEGLRDWKII